MLKEKKERDIEYGQVPTQPTQELHRAMSSRQVQMIAVAGTIGTGLFLGTGTALAEGGPASIILAYSLAGCIVYATMCALGEMATYLPTTGSFTDYACRFLGESYGFSVSWIYWLQQAITLAADLTAAQVLLEFWTKEKYPEFPTVIISVIFLAILVGLNGIHVKGYAEGEYWLSILKVITIIVFIITGVVVSAGANTSGGFSYWTIGEAPFAHGIGGFASVFVTAAFAYAGTESISITAGETKNPKRNMPRIIRNVFYRILIFYIVALFVITLNVPYNMPGLAGATKQVTKSPFTMVFQSAGIEAAAHVVNAVILSSCLSAGNHALFSGTRILFALARRGQAPRILAHVNQKGVPLYSVFTTALISVGCFSLYFLGSGSRAIFESLLVMVGVSTQIAWITIAFASFGFRRALAAQSRSVSELPFVNKWFPYGNYVVIISVSCLLLGQAVRNIYLVFDAKKFFSFVLDFPILACLYLGYKYLAKPASLSYDKMDLDTGRYFDTAEDQAENEKEEAEKYGFKYYFKKIFFFMF